MVGAAALPVRAHDDSMLRKTARISWHALEVAAGLSLLNSWHTKTGGKCNPCTKFDYCCSWQKNCYLIASAYLLWHGLKGVNRELHITDQFKK